MTDTLPLGTQVTVKRKLFREGRKAVWRGQMHYSKVWTPVPWLHEREKEGVIVGIRRVSSGWTEYRGYDEPPAWMPEEYLTVYLVAFDLHRDPLRVLPDDVEPVLAHASMDSGTDRGPFYFEAE